MTEAWTLRFVFKASVCRLSPLTLEPVTCGKSRSWRFQGAGVRFMVCVGLNPVPITR